MHSDRLITRNSNACICNNIEVYNLEGSLTQCFQKLSVIATNEEPIEGWTDNIYGLNGVIAGIALGIIRVMYLDDVNNGDIIPADIVVNGVLAAGWQTYVER